MTELLRSWISQGKSMILASHILYEVEAISPAFLLICGGRLLASGSSEEVESMLAEVPNEIVMRCAKPAELAKLLVQESSVESLRYADDGLVVSTRSPLAVFQHLPGWLKASDVRVEEMRSADDSLQNLFNTLMRIHRGEI
jgi:ABC-2 type transport system ATP-binding protein